MKSVKKTVVKLIEVILKEASRDDEMNPKVLKWVISYLIRIFSDYDYNDIKIKYKGCEYWSLEALELLKNNGHRTKVDNKELFVHDHAIPVTLLYNALISNTYGNNVQKFLDNNAVTCVITKKENRLLDKEYLKSNMPGDGSGRYHKAGIAYRKVDWVIKTNSTISISSETECNESIVVKL